MRFTPHFSVMSVMVILLNGFFSINSPKAASKACLVKVDTVLHPPDSYFSLIITYFFRKINQNPIIDKKFIIDWFLIIVMRELRMYNEANGSLPFHHVTYERIDEYEKKIDQHFFAGNTRIIGCFIYILLEGNARGGYRNENDRRHQPQCGVYDR
jgi:hypothetical protein